MFTITHEYDRNILLHFVGSRQQQSGIIWGEKEPSCVIVTTGGRGGKRAGYGDIRNPDGSILYIGQGEKGDQDVTKFSNSLLIEGERSVLLFTTREPNAEEVRQRGNHRKLYRFEGIYQVASWDFFTSTEGKRANDKLLRFLLVPANNIYNAQSATIQQDEKFSNIHKPPSKPSLNQLKKNLINASAKPSKGQLNARDYFIRSQQIIIYAKERAKGCCERCNKAAPFFDIYGTPYLEVHHIFRLADDGPDIPINVAAICPNCHKEAHYGINRDKIKEELSKCIIEKEQLINISEDALNN